MTDFFPAAVKIILEDEGVLSDQAGDAGGETKWGIARNMHPEITDEQWAVWTVSDSVAKYKSGYWDNHRFGELPWAWALPLFDGEVNQGSVIKLAQTTLGLKPDGNVGDATIARIARATEEELCLFLAGRAHSYIADSLFPTDWRGWYKRLFKTARQAALPPPQV